MKKISDKKELLAMVEKDPSAIQYADDTLINDFEAMQDIASAAYENDGDYFGILKHMGDKLKNDSDKMLSLYEYEGSGALQCFGDKLKNDKSFMLKIINDMNNKGELNNSTTTAYVAQNIGEELKKDKDIMLILVRHYGLALQYADDTLKNDEDIALAAIADAPTAIKYVSKDLVNNKSFISKAKENEIFREYLEGWKEKRRAELLEQQLQEKNKMR